MRRRHEPVLAAAVLRHLLNGPGLYLDATLGDGGHAEALLESEPRARLLGTDRDPAALAFAGERLARFGERVMLAHATFREVPAAHAARGGEPLAGALLDLGLSSHQIDDAARGMSFMQDGPLDLRMDPTRDEGAAQRLARVEPEELAHLLRVHGDVTAAMKIARALVLEARAGTLATTRQLVAVMDRALGGPSHPRRYAQVFQALRIWVNAEADELEAMLEWLPGAMRPGGVVVTLAYHSGEDRRIKQSLRGPRPEPALRRQPWIPDQRPPEGPWEMITRKVEVPPPDEIESNPRARSARLRAFRRKSA